MNDFTVRGGRKLRLGYTTGTCAAAASGAAAEGLLSGGFPEFYRLTVPNGTEISLEILDPVLETEFAVCGVKKDGGDDVDATHGAVICARERQFQAVLKLSAARE